MRCPSYRESLEKQRLRCPSGHEFPVVDRALERVATGGTLIITATEIFDGPVLRIRDVDLRLHPQMRMRLSHLRSRFNRRRGWSCFGGWTA